MLKRISGVSNLITVPKKASVAFPNGGAVTFDAGTGFIKPLVTTDPSVFGVIQQKIASTDGDYASNTPVLVDQSNNQELWEADVTGTLAATDVGQFFKMGATSDVIDASTRSSTAGAGFTAQGLVFICVGFISTTKGLFKIMSQSQSRPSST
jgi:hypothetical protein